jgi:hypothetical protein
MMQTKLSQSILFLTLLFSILSLQAREKPSISTRLDFVNQNVWRGCYQAGASIQPEAVVSFRNFEFSVWGTTDFEVVQKEIDLTAKYGWQNFSIGVTDYWCDAATASYRTGHIPEINLEYGFAKIPLSLSFNTVVYGDNKRFSSYAEILFSPSWQEWQMEFAAGVTPWGNFLLDAERFAITCLSAGIRKTVPLSAAFSFEAFGRLVYNPAADNAFWIAGIGIPF